MAASDNGAPGTMSRPSAKQLRMAAFTKCRTFGHTWDHVDTWDAEGALVMKLRCTRCTMERLDHITPYDSQVVRRKYIAPAGYSASQGEKMTRTEWRRRFLKTLFSSYP